MINFDDIKYLPALRTRLWELKGYRELGDDDKNALFPMLTLTKHHQKVDVASVMQVVNETVAGRSFFLDLETNPLLACSDCHALANPAGAFESWRQFVATVPNVTPVALMTSASTVRNVVQQVILLEQSHGQVVVRSRNPASDLQTLSAIVSAVGSIDNLLVVLDFGYIRSRVQAVAIEVANIINSLRASDPAVRVVVMGSSYPRSAAAYDDAGAALEIEERTLHAAIGGDQVAIYGDHASVHPEPFEPMQSRFVPRIDYALPDSWIFRRVRSDQGGFQRCAELIVALPDWDPQLLTNHVWGAERIQAAAHGDIAGMGTPGAWIAVRVNLHLWQQMNYPDELDVDIFG